MTRSGYRDPEILRNAEHFVDALLDYEGELRDSVLGMELSLEWQEVERPGQNGFAACFANLKDRVLSRIHYSTCSAVSEFSLILMPRRWGSSTSGGLLATYLLVSIP